MKRRQGCRGSVDYLQVADQSAPPVIPLLSQLTMARFVHSYRPAIANAVHSPPPTAPFLPQWQIFHSVTFCVSIPGYHSTLLHLCKPADCCPKAKGLQGTMQQLPHIRRFQRPHRPEH